MSPLREFEKEWLIEWDTFEPGSYRLAVGPIDAMGDLKHRFIFSRRRMSGLGWYREVRFWVWIHRTDVDRLRLINSGICQNASMAKLKSPTSTTKKRFKRSR